MCLCVVSAATYLKPQEDNIYPPKPAICWMIKLTHIFLQQGDGVLIPGAEMVLRLQAPCVAGCQNSALFIKVNGKLPHGDAFLNQDT